VYEGEFKDSRRDGQGTMRYASGNIYTGGFRKDRREGVGTYCFADGRAHVSTFRLDKAVGVGVFWSADRSRAWRLRDGRQEAEIGRAAAEALAVELGARVPPPAAPK
jgi:hypothetical protein